MPKAVDGISMTLDQAEASMRRPGLLLLAVGMLCTSSRPVSGQRFDPRGITAPHSVLISMARIDAMNRHMDRGMIAGASAGLIYGLLAEPRSTDHGYQVWVDGMVGLGAGALAGAAYSIVTRATHDNPIPSHINDSVFPLLAWKIEKLSRYAGLGARLGGGLGLLYGMSQHSGTDRGLMMLWDGGLGFAAGSAVGLVTYLIDSHRQ
jgi:hypothetical protein